MFWTGRTISRELRGLGVNLQRHREQSTTDGGFYFQKVQGLLCNCGTVKGIAEHGPFDSHSRAQIRFNIYRTGTLFKPLDPDLTATNLKLRDPITNVHPQSDGCDQTERRGISLLIRAVQQKINGPRPSLPTHLTSDGSAAHSRRPARRSSQFRPARAP